ncbi:hypothetical protein U9M48_004270 [Paspalum notatum var. saurae]|uniref:Reverse transcriptase Ty1/copia-type domain-containing protein n=1 Tax=Paspalum notatum var. saurae TaxID=547442 RepID=A0AAQ3PMB2_PASNO
MVCRLHSSLYGLKQPPRAWFQCFASVVTAAGFFASAHDPALFVQTSSRGRTLLLLYVDDMIITRDDPQFIAFVKARLGEQFLMSDLGPLRYFLGIEVSSTHEGFYLSQEKYIQGLLDRASITDHRTNETPIELNVQFTRDNLVSIEFDPGGFSIKDLQTRREILRYTSDGDLNTFPTAAIAASTAHTHLVVSPTVWHRLSLAFLYDAFKLIMVNGKAECIICTLNNFVCNLLLQASMPAPYWAKALTTSTYLLNRRPSSAIHGLIPTASSMAPTLLYATFVSSVAFAIPICPLAPHKLAPRSAACVFLGYPSAHKGYRCLDLTTRLVLISRHVMFDESIFSFASSSVGSSSLDFLVKFEDPPAPCVRPLAAALPFMDVGRMRTLTGAPSSTDVERPWSLPQVAVPPAAMPLAAPHIAGPEQDDLAQFQLLHQAQRRSQCHFMHDPHEPHLALIKRILHYVTGNLSVGLHLSTGPVQSLTVYSMRTGLAVQTHGAPL